MSKQRQTSFANSRAMFEQKGASSNNKPNVDSRRYPKPSIVEKKPLHQKQEDNNNNINNNPLHRHNSKPPNLQPKPAVKSARPAPPQPTEELQDDPTYEVTSNDGQQSTDSGYNEEFYIEPEQFISTGNNTPHRNSNKNRNNIVQSEETYEEAPGEMRSPVEIVPPKPKGMPGQHFLEALNKMTSEKMVRGNNNSLPSPSNGGGSGSVGGRPPTMSGRSTHRSPPPPPDEPADDIYEISEESQQRGPDLPPMATHPSQKHIQNRPPPPIPPQEENQQPPPLPPLSTIPSRKISFDSPRTSFKERQPLGRSVHS